MELKLYINNQVASAHVRWEEAVVSMDFVSDYAPSINLSDVELHSDAYDKLKQFFSTNGWTTPCPVKIEWNEDGQSILLVEGLILAKNCVFDDFHKRVKCSIDIDTKNDFFSRISGKILPYYFPNLEKVLICVTPETEEYVIVAFLLMMTLIAIELYRQAHAIVKTTNDFIAHLTGGVTGPAAAPVWLGVELIIQIALFAFIFSQFVKMAKHFFNLILGKYIEVPYVNLYSYLMAIISDAGYNVEMPQELEHALKEAYIINPSPGMQGYEASELVELIKNLFNVKVFAFGRKVIFYHNLYSSKPHYNANWHIDKPAITRYKYNIDEIKGRYVYEFAPDYAETRSLKKERLVELILSGFVGFERINIPFARADVKDGPSKIEKVWNDMVSVLDKIGAKGLTNDKAKERLIHVAVKDFAPKLVFAQSLRPFIETKTPSDVFEQFYVREIEQRQAKIYEDVVIPFNLDMFKNVLNMIKIGGYGVREIEWTPARGKASVKLYEKTNYKRLDKKIIVV